MGSRRVGSSSASGANAKGQKSKGQPFDRVRRDHLISLVREGASTTVAAKLSRVAMTTVCRWLRNGRLEGAHPEHRAFAQAFDEAESECIHKVTKLLHGHAEQDHPGAVKAALAILQARDPRFGDRALQKRKTKAEAELAEVKLAAAKKALEGGGAGAIILGVEALLEGPLSEVAKAEIRQAIADGKIRTLSKWGLGDEAA